MASGRGAAAGRRAVTARASGGLAVACCLALIGLLAGPQAHSAAEDAEADTLPPEQGVQPLAVLDPTEAPDLDPSAVAAAIATLLDDPALGPAPGTAVLDADTGEVVFDDRGSVALTPASSLKIVTGLAVLDSLGPDTQLATEVVRNPDGALVLVGGGDPSLLTLPPEDDTAYPKSATLADLAAQAAQALQEAGVAEVSLAYDSTLFPGPALHPDWDPDFVGFGIISPVAALKVDPEAADIDQAALDADPAAASAQWFAQRLRAAGIEVAAVAPGRAAEDAEPLAAVSSAPMAALVDRMLDISDNDYAEALFRLAALGRNLPATFEGGVQAATQTLASLGAPTDGLVVRDGSGLSRGNQVMPLTLAVALQAAADPQPDEPTGSGESAESGESDGDGGAGGDAGTGAGGDAGGAEGAQALLDAITWAPPGLAVGGLTGSLSGRFQQEETESGAGRVRAKTGTLTGVTSLTGVVATEQGRPLVFAVVGNETPDTVAARAALDAVAAALARCGCAAGSA